ncbi:MAG: hypothetical protein Q9160_007863 [Pyrenula sp. 1 TL-2023]
MADALKAEGNKAFAAKDFTLAIEKFSQAIEIEPTNHVLYSNRSGAYASLKKYDEALTDANKTTEVKGDWVKGWSRKGSALHGLWKLEDARDAFNKALELEPTNSQAKTGLDSVERTIEEEKTAGGDPLGGLGNIFNDPQMFNKLASNPKTSHLLGNPQFMAKLQRLKSNPSDISTAFQDPQMLQVLSVLMGIDMSFGQPPEGATSASTEAKEEEEEDVPMPDARPPSQANKDPEPEPEPEDDEAIAKKKAKDEADAQKKLGTESYKKRQFDAAIEHYSKAWEMHKDITYLTNRSAAEFEKGDYNAAIKTCEEAISEGRLVLADFKLIAKAFGRIGSSYEKLGDLANAIDNYQRSLTEHRTPEILAKFKAAEKAKVKADTDAYVSPEEAEKARELGNQKFKDSDWPGAVEAYSEMAKRAPEDPRGYSNRAAALIKLMSFPGAVQDCDEAIKRDSNFIRAYLRKAQALFGMKEYNKCIDVCTEATQHDDGKNAREIDQQQQKALEALYSARAGETEEQTAERIQRDPDIMTILQDPVMQSILQQAKDNPAALQDHMKNPDIANKVRRLIQAGVIRMGR